MIRITLPWIEKFRELNRNKDLQDNEIIGQFSDFCDEQEKEINKLWEEKRHGNNSR
jgi:hypothetical protein